MRDVFFDDIYEVACKDRDIIILSADFSAPSLDKYRLNLPSQYQFVGIAEQSMLLVAAGMALEGKRPICYAIAPFLTMRAFEQTRLYASGMDLPIALVGVGAGIAYDESGYTHHAVEDIAIMRTLPHMKVFIPCDNCDVNRMVDYYLKADHPTYVRFDRYGMDSLYDGEHDIENGISCVRKAQSITLIATGGMMKIAISAAEALASNGIEVGILNVESIPFNSEKFKDMIKDVEDIITIEEHTLVGGLGSYVLEEINDVFPNITVHRIGFDLSKGFVEEFGGREVVFKKYGMDKETVVSTVKRIIRS